MLPSRHIAVSLSLGAIVVLFSESFLAGVLCFFSGVAIDVDHIFDYIKICGLRNFNFQQMYQDCLNISYGKENKMKKLYLFFHSVEIALLLWLGFGLTQNLYLLSLALGYSGHLLLDLVANILNPASYFIFWRIKNGFSTDKLAQQRRGSWLLTKGVSGWKS